LRTLGLLESLNELLKVAGWVDYLNMTKSVYKRLRWEFLSSFKVNWTTSYQNQLVHIQFLLFNRTFEANLVEFERLLRLPNSGVWIAAYENFNDQ